MLVSQRLTQGALRGHALRQVKASSPARRSPHLCLNQTGLPLSTLTRLGPLDMTCGEKGQGASRKRGG
jgi:hypothetical protein